MEREKSCCAYDSTWEEEEDDDEAEEQLTEERAPSKGKNTSGKKNSLRMHEGSTRQRNLRAAQDMQNYRHGYPGLEDEDEDSPEMPNLRFYQNIEKFKPSGVLIEELLSKWSKDYQLLEQSHSYIQWLFPLREAGMNWCARPLTKKELEEFKKNKEVKERFVRAYKLMLDFYGIELVDEVTGKLNRAQHYERRFQNLNWHSHNNLRITRILKCLGEMGFEHFQVKLVKFFLKETLKDRLLLNVKQSALDYFLFTVRDRQERQKLVHYAWKHFDPQERFAWGPHEKLKRFKEQRRPKSTHLTSSSSSTGERTADLERQPGITGSGLQETSVVVIDENAPPQTGDVGTENGVIDKQQIHLLDATVNMAAKDGQEKSPCRTAQTTESKEEEEVRLVSDGGDSKHPSLEETVCKGEDYGTEGTLPENMNKKRKLPGMGQADALETLQSTISDETTPRNQINHGSEHSTGATVNLTGVEEPPLPVPKKKKVDEAELEVASLEEENQCASPLHHPAREGGGIPLLPLESKPECVTVKALGNDSNGPGCSKKEPDVEQEDCTEESASLTKSTQKLEKSANCDSQPLDSMPSLGKTQEGSSQKQDLGEGKEGCIKAENKDQQSDINAETSSNRVQQVSGLCSNQCQAGIISAKKGVENPPNTEGSLPPNRDQDAELEIIENLSAGNDQNHDCEIARSHAERMELNKTENNGNGGQDKNEQSSTEQYLSKAKETELQICTPARATNGKDCKNLTEQEGSKPMESKDQEDQGNFKPTLVADDASENKNLTKQEDPNPLKENNNLAKQDCLSPSVENRSLKEQEDSNPSQESKSLTVQEGFKPSQGNNGQAEQEVSNSSQESTNLMEQAASKPSEASDTVKEIKSLMGQQGSSPMETDSLLAKCNSLMEQVDCQPTQATGVMGENKSPTEKQVCLPVLGEQQNPAKQQGC
ncbi:opioid growth factor receptor isoform X2 [Ambystoma mexicanum]|uniref:opioid growth factor receptor isoform X2 n=1 Tax=Ambystoma mexicanum TaxID=8296 RepID=UPI0037E88B75